MAGSPAKPIEVSDDDDEVDEEDEIGEDEEDEEDDEEEEEGVEDGYGQEPMMVDQDDYDEEEEEEEEVDEEEEEELLDDRRTTAQGAAFSDHGYDDVERSDDGIEVIEDGEGDVDDVDELEDDDVHAGHHYAAPPVSSSQQPIIADEDKEEDEEQEGEEEDDEERSPTPPPIWGHAGATYDFMAPPAGSVDLDSAAAVNDNLIETVLGQLPPQVFAAPPFNPVAESSDIDPANAFPNVTMPLDPTTAYDIPVQGTSLDSIPIDPSLVEVLPAAEGSAAPMQGPTSYSHSTATFIAGEYGTTYVAEHSMAADFVPSYSVSALDYTEVTEQESSSGQAADEIESPAVRSMPMLRDESAITILAPDAASNSATVEDGTATEIRYNLAENTVEESIPTTTARPDEEGTPDVSDDVEDVSEASEKEAPEDSREESEEIEEVQADSLDETMDDGSREATPELQVFTGEGMRRAYLLSLINRR